MRLSHMHAHLLSEIDGRTFQPLLQEITSAHAALARYKSWREAVRDIGSGRSPKADEDLVLIHAITRYAGGDCRWSSILLAASFDWLSASCLRRSAWDRCDDEVWQELIVAFFDVCGRLAARGTREGLRRRLLAGTLHRLHDSFSRRWRLESRESLTDPSDLPDRSDTGSESSRWDTAIDLRDLQDRMTAGYAAAREAGVIDGLDFEIVVGTRVQGRTVEDESGRLGISFACAKKRRQRAESALSRAGMAVVP